MTRVGYGDLLKIPHAKWGKGAAGFTYYVDSVNGDDANAGTSELAPLQTLAAVPALSNGQGVGLARGSTFRSDKFADIITANNVTIGAYGTGDRPVIISRAILAAGSWSKTGGFTNVYEQAITFDADASGVVFAFEDGAYLTRQTSTANVDANAGSFYCTNDTSGSATLYIHATGSSNPGSNGRVYEFTDTTLVINSFTATGMILSDIVFTSSVYQNGPVYLGKGSSVYRCDFNQGSRHNFIARGGLYMEDCVFADGYNIGSGTTLFVCYEETATSSDTVHLVRCTATNANGVGANTGYLNHDAGAGEFGTVHYEDCTATDCGTGFSLINSELYQVSGATIADCTYGISCGVATTFEIDSPTMTNVDFGIAASATGAIVEITNPTISVRSAAYGGGIYANTAAVITLTGGTLTADAPTFDGARGCYAMGNAVSNWTISGVRYAIRRPLNFLTTFHVLSSMDYNSYSTAALLWKYNGVDYVGFAAWKATGFDANSTQDT